VNTNTVYDTQLLSQQRGAATTESDLPNRKQARRTPRRSLIVVLPEDHVVSSDQLAARLPLESDGEDVDVILACAGQPTSIAALQRTIRDLQILLAPVGTSAEDLREIAMKQAVGDIVTLLSGTPRLATKL